MNANLRLALRAADRNDWARVADLTRASSGRRGRTQADAPAGRGVVIDAPADPMRRRAVAFHEASHQVAARVLYGASAVGPMKFTHGDAGGVCYARDPDGATRIQRLTVSLAGPSGELMGRMLYAFGRRVDPVKDEDLAGSGVVDPTPEELAQARYEAHVLVGRYGEVISRLANRFFDASGGELTRDDVLAFFSEHRYFL